MVAFDLMRRLKPTPTEYALMIIAFHLEPNTVDSKSHGKLIPVLPLANPSSSGGQDEETSAVNCSQPLPDSTLRL